MKFRKFFKTTKNNKIMLIIGLVFILIGWFNFMINHHKHSLWRWIVVIMLTLIGIILINGVLGLFFGGTALILLSIDGSLTEYDFHKNKRKVLETNDKSDGE
ncbi:hypothetical protein [Spiroplasma citri]|uniref:Hypothetical transmembrane protein n=2 Tax=Spiroplasma citri TaxID=2133 RepID=Q14NY2_SPICI|nr:hypothetical protein [Spiroplasma citri]QIA69327.1 hypothetical protein GL298_07405 [Spiroplasma citri]QIA71194.1 hypothetical protein GL981_07460 [Spiroplasma citri]QIA73265.1 hypothetical protein GL982_06410 [Spiroplasma citri]QIA75362.1 hypothetical protein GTU57_06705 [Spiroplasma citri]QJU62093.1 hypothetical protein HHA36_06970 [Spiroplasma citri]